MEGQVDMNDSDCGLSLHDVHASIECTIASIREKHEQVDTIFGDIGYLKRTVDDVLKPINHKARLKKISSVADLRTLLACCARMPTPNAVGLKSARVPTPPTKVKPRSRAFSDGRIDINRGAEFSLPPIAAKSQSAKNPRALPGSGHSSSEMMVVPIGCNKSCRADVVISPSKTHNFAQSRRERLLRRRSNADSSLNIKHFELNRFLDDFERELSVLQETFSTFTQKTLVPLQIFCKLCNKTDSGKDESFEKRVKSLCSTKGGLGETEFRIVQTMNQIRLLLWANEATGLSENLFCADHFSKKVALEIDCETFPVVRLIPDVLQKFNQVLNLASTWLKRDILFVQNAKSGLQRAHRRFLKTERHWRQARDSQRQLRNDFDSATGDLQSQTARLDTLGEDIKRLKTQLERTRRMKLVIEEKLKTSDDNIETLVARHRSLRKQILLLCTKIEARERSHGFLNSRVLSLKADRDAVSEKLRISEDYTASLQKKMEELYRARDAWSKRYEEKTDPEKLETRLHQTQIRMPLPSLQEKTFIIRSGMENLQRALELVEKRLGADDIHWSKLCEQLPWPDEDNSASPDSNGDFNVETIRQDSLEPPECDCKKIKDEVITARPEDERQQTSFMLQLWLHKNGREATMDKLIRALKASNICSVAESLERQMS